MKVMFFIEALSLLLILGWFLWGEICDELHKLPAHQRKLSNSHVWKGFINGGMLYWPPSTVIVLLFWVYKSFFK